MKTIESISRANVDKVVEIHRRAYNDDHFSTLMNDTRLASYYLNLCGTSGDTSFLCTDGSRPIGFVICGEGLNQNVKLFLRKNCVYLFFVVARHPSFWIAKTKALFTRFAKKKKWRSDAAMRVLSIAVDVSRQKAGYGREMLLSLEERLQQRGINLYGLSVKKSNPNAIRFYMLNGFEREYVDERTEYYLKRLR